MTRDEAAATRDLFWEARQRLGLKRTELVEQANQHSDAPIPDHLPRFLETQIVDLPRRMEPVRAVAAALSLPWERVLEAMGVR